MPLNCPLCSPQEMEQRWKPFGQRAFIWVQLLRLHWRWDKAELNSAGNKALISEVRSTPVLGSCVYELPSSQKFHCSSREGTVARRKVSQVPEMFAVIPWETGWFDGHRSQWELWRFSCFRIMLLDYKSVSLLLPVTLYMSDCKEKA